MLETREKERYGQNLPQIEPGDTVRVHVRIVEGNRERVQVFEGVVLAISGSGANRSITVRRMGAHGVGVERIFPLYSPRIERFEVVRRAKARRAKDRKSTRLNSSHANISHAVFCLIKNSNSA